MSNIKTEPGIKLEPGTAPQIKPEPGVSPAAIKHDPDLYEDDELYEDPGDLDISSGGRAVWLVKLPSFVAERWNEIDDDEEITLGYVKVNNSDENGSRNVSLFCHLGILGAC
jgi:transcription initiation factor TFIIF subunit beta